MGNRICPLIIVASLSLGARTQKVIFPTCFVEFGDQNWIVWTKVDLIVFDTNCVSRIACANPIGRNKQKKGRQMSRHKLICQLVMHAILIETALLWIHWQWVRRQLEPIMRQSMSKNLKAIKISRNTCGKLIGVCVQRRVVPSFVDYIPYNGFNCVDGNPRLNTSNLPFTVFYCWNCPQTNVPQTFIIWSPKWRSTKMTRGKCRAAWNVLAAESWDVLVVGIKWLQKCC